MSSQRYPKWTVSRNFIDLVKLFIEEGSDINSVDNDGKTPLKIAKEEDLIDVIDLLRQYGAKE